jgi:hypothetical protein
MPSVILSYHSGNFTPWLWWFIILKRRFCSITVECFPNLIRFYQCKAAGTWEIFSKQGLQYQLSECINPISTASTGRKLSFSAVNNYCSGHLPSLPANEHNASHHFHCSEIIGTDKFGNVLMIVFFWRLPIYKQNHRWNRERPCILSCQNTQYALGSGPNLASILSTLRSRLLLHPLVIFPVWRVRDRTSRYEGHFQKFVLIPYFCTWMVARRSISIHLKWFPFAVFRISYVNLRLPSLKKYLHQIRRVAFTSSVRGVLRNRAVHDFDIIQERPRFIRLNGEYFQIRNSRIHHRITGVFV